MRKIGITGVGSLIGQGIIKSIINSPYANEYELIGFDYFPDTVGSFWCQKNYILSDILKKDKEQQWFEEILSIIKEDKIELLFIGVDFELPLFVKYKSIIEKETSCLIIVSDERVIEIGNDKFKTFQFLKENGLYYPETYEPENCDFSSLTFPVIVKPRIGARSIGVSKVDSLDKLEEVLKHTQDPIIQECVGDDTTEYTCGVIALNGELKHSIALNRTLKAGNTHLSSYSKDTPEIVTQYLKDITDKLKPFGSCNYQLRIDSDGIPKMFEINARHSGTTYMRSLFGFNEIIYILKSVLEGQEIDFNLKEGKAIRYFEERLVS
jgi:carbamoyl-phosphate synthase large subunit